MEQGTFNAAVTEAQALVKLCGCGCGEPAPIATRTRPEFGHVKGQPLNFIQGHGAKRTARTLRLRAGQVAQFVRICGCGCGHPTPISAPYGAVKGQPLEFAQGHRPLAEEPRRKLFVEAGQRFGIGVVVDPEIRHVAASGTSYRAARLVCDCGTEFVRMIDHLLRRRGPQSCGNCAGGNDLTGRRFGHLTAVRWIPVGSRWVCRCDCGNEVTHSPSELLRGRAKSCGCAKRGPRGSHGDAAFNNVHSKYQRGARERGLPWDLGVEDFRRLTSLDCHYCGTAPSTVLKTNAVDGGYVYNGLDRVDNSRGYTLDNVVPCCGICNHAKGTMSYGEFLAWISRLASFHFFRPDMTPARLLKTSA